MTKTQAKRVLRELGASSTDLSSHANLKRFRKRFAVRHHPDRGGDTAQFVRMNSAVQALLALPEDPSTSQSGASGPSNLDFTLEELVSRARDLGFFRVQRRDYVPYPDYFSKKAGYYGRVVQTRTVRRDGKKGMPDDLVAEGIREVISQTAERVGQDVEHPDDLIVKLTLVEPKGKNPGYAAVAWKTQQDSTARMFGHSTRWWSMTLTMTPGDEKKWKARGSVDTGGIAQQSKDAAKRERWNRYKVMAALADAGFSWVSGDRQQRWAPQGTPKRGIKNTPHLILTQRTIKTSDSYMGYGQFYFGELTRAKLDELIRGAGGVPRGQRMFIQPSNIPIRKAKTVALILASGGAGTRKQWELMDTWVASHGLRSVLNDLRRIYEANSTPFSTAEENWWISQLS